MTTIFNYYKILGLDASADDAKIKAAHRRLSREYHPDKVEGMVQEFHDVQRAFKALETRTRRFTHRGQMMGLGRSCGGCYGRGYTRKQIGFNSLITAPCETCGGCGYLSKVP